MATFVTLGKSDLMISSEEHTYWSILDLDDPFGYIPGLSKNKNTQIMAIAEWFDSFSDDWTEEDVRNATVEEIIDLMQECNYRLIKHKGKLTIDYMEDNEDYEEVIL